jgi:hypothetical protein
VSSRRWRFQTQMSALQCGHEANGKTWQICEHLLANVEAACGSPHLEHYRRFSGKGVEHQLLCKDCSASPGDIRSGLREVCNECYDAVAVAGKRLGEIGSPEIRQREAGLAFVHETRALNRLSERIVAMAPVECLERASWLGITEGRVLISFDFRNGEVRDLVSLDTLGVPLTRPFSLLASPDGDFAVVASAYGENGVVVDLGSGRVTLRLSRGNYHTEHCRFSMAIFKRAGELYLVHPTAWNRLDISDPRSGRLLSERGPTSFKHGEPRPEHYLDYFHCSVSVSPDGEYLADNGWVWHPVGVVTAWSLKDWLESNVWESEDGPSLNRLCWRDYFWDGPTCWVGNRKIAVWGIGDDDYLMVPGIRVFDVESGKETGSFAGPVNEQVTETAELDGKVSNYVRSAGTLLFDRFLFSSAPAAGMTVWDVADGARLLHEPDFHPQGFHRGMKQFVTQRPDGSFRLTVLKGTQ